jgi:hypothetical protein
MKLETGKITNTSGRERPSPYGPEDGFTAEARRLLTAKGAWRKGASREDPVTGIQFVHGLDPVVCQIRDAAKALRARDRFARANPGLPPLPLSYPEWGRLKGAFDLNHALARYARSLESWNYNIDAHPPFDAYVCGLMCDERLRGMFSAIADRFPPEPLKGLSPGASTVIGTGTGRTSAPRTARRSARRTRRAPARAVRTIARSRRSKRA